MPISLEFVLLIFSIPELLVLQFRKYQFIDSHRMKIAYVLNLSYFTSTDSIIIRNEATDLSFKLYYNKLYN